jgi:perosamine synthetase
MATTRKYWHDTVGFNYRMTNLQAAIGVAQLEKIDHLLNSRHRLRQYYDRTLGCLPIVSAAIQRRGARSVTWLVSYLLDAGIDRDGFIQAAGACSIDVRPFFYPLSDMPPYQGMAPRFTPHAHTVSARGVNLPTSPCLKTDVYDRITDTLIDILIHLQPPERLQAAVGA